MFLGTGVIDIGSGTAYNALVERIYNKEWRRCIKACPSRRDQQIRCPAFGQVFAYLVQGEERALLIDNGFGNEDIRPFLQTLTDLPIMAVNTHAHPDHAGSNPLSARSGSASMMYPTRSPCPFPRRISRLRRGEKSPAVSLSLPARRDRIGLGGGREVTVCEVPGHSPGHIVFADSVHASL